MPTYVYKFVETGETIEVQQGFHDENLTEIAHPDSGEVLPVKKVFTPVGVTFKGSGFFKTDNRGKKSATVDSVTSAVTKGTAPPAPTAVRRRARPRRPRRSRTVRARSVPIRVVPRPAVPGRARVRRPTADDLTAASITSAPTDSLRSSIDPRRHRCTSRPEPDSSSPDAPGSTGPSSPPSPHSPPPPFTPRCRRSQPNATAGDRHAACSWRRQPLEPGDPIVAELVALPIAALPDAALTDQPDGAVVRQRVAAGEVLTRLDVTSRSGPATLAEPGTVVDRAVRSARPQRRRGAERSGHRRRSVGGQGSSGDRCGRRGRSSWRSVRPRRRSWPRPPSRAAPASSISRDRFDQRAPVATAISTTTPRAIR